MTLPQNVITQTGVFRTQMNLFNVFKRTICFFYRGKRPS